MNNNSRNNSNIDRDDRIYGEKSLCFLHISINEVRVSNKFQVLLSQGKRIIYMFFYDYCWNRRVKMRQTHRQRKK